MEDNNNSKTTLDDVMGFLKENMVMNEDFEHLQNNMAAKDDLKGFATKDDLKGFATKDDLKQAEDRIMTRLSEMQFELEDIKTRLDTIEKRLKEDVDAVVIEVEKLKNRIMVLEQQLGIRQQGALVN